MNREALALLVLLGAAAFVVVRRQGSASSMGFLGDDDTDVSGVDTSSGVVVTQRDRRLGNAVLGLDVLGSAAGGVAQALQRNRR